MLKALVSLVALFAMQSVYADVIEQVITVPMSVERDSNPLLSSSNKQSVMRTRVVPRYQFTSGDGVKEINADFALALERSSDESVSLNREDPSLNLGWKTLLPQGEFSLNAHYDQASTRIAELTETGLVQADGSRRSRSFNGSYRHALSELLNVSLNAGYNRVSYSGGTLTNFALPSASVALNYQYSETIIPFIQASVSRFNPDDNNTPESDFMSVVTGAEWHMSERLNLQFNVGVNQVNAVTNDTNFQGLAKIEYLADRTQTTAEIARSTTSSGNGGFIVANQFQAGISHELNNRSRVGSNVSLRQNKGGVAANSDFYNLNLFYQYEITPQWNMRVNTQFRQRKDDAGQTANANMLGFTLNYTTLTF